MRQPLRELVKCRPCYRELIVELITDVANAGTGEKLAVAAIKEYTANPLDVVDQVLFTEVTETELMSLHGGNIARYRLSPSELSEWKEHCSED